MLDEEIVQAGLSAQRKMASLMTQAISASTTPEKNRIIDELKQVWKLQKCCAERVNQSIAAMRESLAKLQEKEAAKTEEYETLCANTAFLDLYEQNPPTEEQKQEKISQIKEIEQEIQQIGNLSAPDLLKKAREADDFRQLKLNDLKFKRLEELSYNLKKRSFVVDESEDMSLMISEQFGSIQD